MSGSDFGDSLFLRFFSEITQILTRQLKKFKYKLWYTLPLDFRAGISNQDILITATPKNMASAPTERTPTAKEVIREVSVSHNIRLNVVVTQDNVASLWSRQDSATGTHTCLLQHRHFWREENKIQRHELYKLYQRSVQPNTFSSKTAVIQQVNNSCGWFKIS